MSENIPFSLPHALADELRLASRDHGFGAVAECVSLAVRSWLAQDEWNRPSDQEVVAVVSLTYSREMQTVPARLATLERELHWVIEVAMRVPLSGELVTEIIVIRAPSSEARRVSRLFMSTRGIQGASVSVVDVVPAGCGGND